MENRKLKSLRVLHGMTQGDMAELLGMTKPTYRTRENGQHDFTESEINTILNTFNVKYEDIFLHNDSLKVNDKEESDK